MNRTRLLAGGAVFALAIIATGCLDTQPEEETFEPRLLVTVLSVAVVPGGTEEITVTATDEYNAPRSFTAGIDNEAVATVVTTDSTITVTGLTCGTATLTVSSDTCTREVPVEVYDAEMLQAGDLLIEFVDEYDHRWSSAGTGDTWQTVFYHPIADDGYSVLGSFCARFYHNPNGQTPALVVKALPGSDALRAPVDYELVWTTQGSGIEDQGSLWNPVPPAGYKALGTVAVRGYDKPDTDEVVCVREDLTVPAASQAPLFGGRNGGGAQCYAYCIEPPQCGPHESCYVATGALTATRIAPDTTGHPARQVLKVQLPMVEEAPDQSFAPQLTGFDTPPENSPPVMCREMTVPWSVVRDSRYPEVERYFKSPKYRVERQVFYKCVHHVYNTSNEPSTAGYSVTYGVTTEESNSYHTETGIEVSVEAGVSFKVFSASVSATVSRSLGYEHQTSISELRQDETTVEMTVPAGSAGAIFQKHTRFILKRHAGTAVVPVSVLEFGINSYVVDTYPDE